MYALDEGLPGTETRDDQAFWRRRSTTRAVEPLVAGEAKDPAYRPATESLRLAGGFYLVLQPCIEARKVSRIVRSLGRQGRIRPPARSSSGR